MKKKEPSISAQRQIWNAALARYLDIKIEYCIFVNLFPQIRFMKWNFIAKFIDLTLRTI